MQNPEATKALTLLGEKHLEYLSWELVWLGCCSNSIWIHLEVPCLLPSNILSIILRSSKILLLLTQLIIYGYCSAAWEGVAAEVAGAAGAKPAARGFLDASTWRRGRQAPGVGLEGITIAIALFGTTVSWSGSCIGIPWTQGTYWLV